MMILEGQIFRADFSRSLGPARCLMAGPSSDLWKRHRRLGHLSFDLVSRLSGLDLVRGLPRLKFEKDLVCALCMSYGPPWAHCLGGYQDRLLGGPLGLPGLRYTAPEGVEHKDYTGVVLG
jgi:hypothetical protein